MTSESTRLVSIWGSPGFGKTSVAIAVGDHLQARELPVYFLSLRGLKSKSDLTSKFLSLFRQAGPLESDNLHDLSADDELCLSLDRISDRCVIILDNADDLLECGVPNVKKEVFNLIGEILNRSGKVKFLLTTRESLAFLNLHFQGHKSVRIRELDKLSCQTLARELLPGASPSDLTNVSQICGQVPLAIKLLCSSISEDYIPYNQFIEFIKRTENILEMLDSPDYPTNSRLRSLFESSFQRLSTQDQEALVSLCILPGHFDLKISAAVLGITRTTEAEKVLRRLQRKSLIDSSSELSKFSMHKLVQSFAREKGEADMKETILISKSRSREFFIAQFEKLNENFLCGRSMSAFIEFYEEEKSIVQSLIDGCLDSRTADRVFDVLAKAELFLDTLFSIEGSTFDKIFDTAIMAARNTGKNVFYRRLLTSKAFAQVTWGTSGNTEKLLSVPKAVQVQTSSQCDGENGKRLCYYGIHQIYIGKPEEGVKVLEQALSSMNTSQEHTILRAIIFQIFAIYYQSKNDSVRSSNFCLKALKECRDARDTGLLVIPMPELARREVGEHCIVPSENQPLKVEVIFLVSKAIENVPISDTNEMFANLLLTILSDCKSALNTSKTGWFNFHRHIVGAVRSFGRYEDALKLAEERISFHQKELQRNDKRKETNGERQKRHEEALAQNYMELGYSQCGKGNYTEAITSFTRALNMRINLFGEEHSKTADSYHEVGVTQHLRGNNTAALESAKRALDIRIKLFGEEHPETADSYHSVGVKQHSLRDYTAALESAKRALDIRIKLFGEEHSETAESHDAVGVRQHSLSNYTSALESKKRALDIRIQLFGEEHPETAESHDAVGVTQHSLSNYTSALESKKRALDIRIKLFGEEHPMTADSWHSVGLTQHSLRDYTAALESEKRALDIRIKLIGDEHPKTADSYHSVGVIQHSLKDYTSALESVKRALDIRIKLFGEEHPMTADSYHEVGVTQHSLKDYTAALESAKSALDIRIKLFGEEHPMTADSYHEVGVTQHSLSDYTAALESKKRALHIRIKLLGEEHSKTADSYHSVGVTQHSLRNYIVALEYDKLALDIRIKLFGEEHPLTADSYHEVGVRQHSLMDYTAALESEKRALGIRIKWFGDEHPNTAYSYHSVGVIQHLRGNNTAALKSFKRALDIRITLFGEEHPMTADSYHEVGVTQHLRGNNTAALESAKRALDIRIKLFGEEHPKTADSYHSLGITQHSQKDYTAALESAKSALDIRIKLFGEDHPMTADSYHEVGVTQHSLSDYTAALESKNRALDIRIKLFGEENSKTADSYHSVGVTQHSLRNYTAALEYDKRSLDIRIKLFGEEHPLTADSYHEVGVRQHSLMDYTAALESEKRALGIRSKWFGKEHPKTAQSCRSVWYLESVCKY